MPDEFGAGPSRPYTNQTASSSQPIPFPLVDSASVGFGSLSARDRMRLAKAALIQAEEAHIEQKRERRRSRRESSVMGPSDNSSLGSSPSPTDSQRDRPLPPSILRRAPPSSFAPIARVTRSASDAAACGADFNPQPLPGDSSRSLTRRSSKVRFSDLNVSSANDPLQALPAIVSAPLPRRKTSLDAMSAPLGLRRQSLNRRTSVASFASSAYSSDPWALQSSSASPAESLKSDYFDGNDGFAPQALPYPKVPRALARLSIRSSASSQTDSDGGSPRSVQPTLRDTLARSSIPTTAPLVIVKKRSTGSLGANSRSSLASFAPSPRDSFASITSTLMSNEYPPSTSTGSSISFGLPRGVVNGREIYTGLLPGRTHNGGDENVARAAPAINRGTYVADLGLSPRTAPSPIAEQPERVEDLPASVVLDSPRPADDQPRPSMAVTVEEQPVEAPKAAPEPTVSRSKHQKTDSTFSVASLDSLQSLNGLSIFPLPPSRFSPALEVSIDVATVPLVSFPDSPRTPTKAEAEKETLKDDAVLLNSPEIPSSSTIAQGAQVPSIVCVDTTSPKTPVAKGGSKSSPTSPTVKDLMRRPSYASGEMSRKISNPIDADSDLEISTPLVQVALKNKILTPHSRLLQMRSKTRLTPTSPLATPTRPPRPSVQRAVSHGKIDFSSKYAGWSGDESEEEEWAEALKQITFRKQASPRTTPTPQSSATVPCAHASDSSASSSGESSSSRSTATTATSVSTLSTHSQCDYGVLTAAPLPPRRTSMEQVNARYSQLSIISSASSTELMTPTSSHVNIRALPSPPRNLKLATSLSSEDASLPSPGPLDSPKRRPGNFNWGGSAPSSPVRSLAGTPTRGSPSPHPDRPLRSPMRGALALSRSLSSSSAPPCTYTSGVATLPRPTRLDPSVWGEPEILVDDADDRWAATATSTVLSARSLSEIIENRMSVASFSDYVGDLRAGTDTTPKTSASGAVGAGSGPGSDRARCPSPGLVGDILAIPVPSFVARASTMPRNLRRPSTGRFAVRI